jgi:hypothetical protein
MVSASPTNATSRPKKTKLAWTCSVYLQLTDIKIQVSSLSSTLNQMMLSLPVQMMDGATGLGKPPGEF